MCGAVLQIMHSADPIAPTQEDAESVSSSDDPDLPRISFQKKKAKVLHMYCMCGPVLELHARSSSLYVYTVPVSRESGWTCS